MRASFLAVAVAALLCGCDSEPALPDPDPATRIELPAGAVVGFVGEYGAHVWRGIPYAEAPVGVKRWAAPAPLAPWSGERRAIAPAPVCPQFPGPFGVESEEVGTIVGQEDCLYLNVFAPAAPGSDRPVLVWIHGGGNVIGHASFYDGGNLAASHDVVVVAVNYRLGPLGWFRHAALRASADERSSSGNFGTLDLVRALEWVRENVAAFGGDPKNVTIFGESAGGRNVASLVLSPVAKGLFHRAIVQSGSLRTLSSEESEGSGHRNSSSEVLLRLLQSDGTAVTRVDAENRVATMGVSALEAHLRSKTPAELLAAYRIEDQEALIDVPNVFADGTVLPAGDAVEVLADGRHNHVPAIWGTNRDENRLFLAFNPEYVRRVFGIPMVRDWDRYEATADHLSRAWRVLGADVPASAMAEGQDLGVWVYRFDWDEEPKRFFLDVSRLLGAAHAFEIPFVFGHWDLGGQTDLFFDESNLEGRLALSRAMMSYWSEFARNGSPGRGRQGALPEWPTYGPSAPDFLVLDTPSDRGIRTEREALTREAVVAGVQDDDRFSDDRARCEIYGRLVRWSRLIPPEDYPDLADGACAGHALPSG